MVGLGSLILLIFIFTFLHEVTPKPGIKSILRSGPIQKPVSEHKTRNPMVVIIDPYKHYTEFLDEIRSSRTEEREEEVEDVPDPKEDAKSLFYHYLRSSPEGESNPEIEKHKSFLRSVLRSRCNSVSKCKQECPKKKPSCPANCQEVFDNLNICEPPKKKKTYKVTYEFECSDEDGCGDNGKDKCKKNDECGNGRGKTMPPKWKMMKH